MFYVRKNVSSDTLERFTYLMGYEDALPPVPRICELHLTRCQNTEDHIK